MENGLNEKEWKKAEGGKEGGVSHTKFRMRWTIITAAAQQVSGLHLTQ